MKINELHKQGKTEYTTKYDYLYHITDNHGYAFTLNTNELRTLRHSYISTTWNPNINSIYGYSHYYFKFIIDAKPLVEKYGAFTYDFHARTSDGEKVSLNEDELGINTKVIENFKEYMLGMILLFPIFSQSALQWLLYDNPAERGFFGPEKTESPRAIDMLAKQLFEWKKPVYIGHAGKAPNEREREFLKDIFRIHRKGGDFQSGLLALADKYPILDHFGKQLDRQMVERRSKKDELTELFNGYFAGRKYRDVNPTDVKKLVKTAMNILNLNNNIQAVVFHAMEEGNLFHEKIAAVDWSIIFRDLIDGDIEDALETIKWVANDRQKAIEWYDERKAKYANRHNANDDDDNDVWDVSRSEHVGTAF